MDLHARYGGVVPELAGRAHLELVVPVVRDALARAGMVDPSGRFVAPCAVAATVGPGLVGSLLVGVSAAKALAMATLDAEAALWGGSPTPHLSTLFGLGTATELTSSDMAHALALFGSGKTAGGTHPGETPVGIPSLALCMPSLAPGVRGVVVSSPSLGEVGIYGFMTPTHKPAQAFSILASELDRPSSPLVNAALSTLARLVRSETDAPAQNRTRAKAKAKT